MNDIAEAAKNNPGTVALLGMILAGGGLNFVSEGAEEEETEELTAELRQADIAQDRRHQELVDMYHDMNLRLALV